MKLQESMLTKAGRVFFGFVAITFYCFILNKIDRYPSQVVSFFLVVLAYIAVWELLFQGWRGFSFLEDTFYFVAGASTYLFIEMQWVIDRLFVALLVICSCLIAGSVKRWRDIEQ